MTAALTGALYANGCSTNAVKTYDGSNKYSNISLADKYKELKDYEICQYMEKGKVCFFHLDNTNTLKVYIPFEKITEYEDFNRDFLVDKVTVTKNDIEKKYDRGPELQKFQKEFEYYLGVILKHKHKNNLKDGLK